MSWPPLSLSLSPSTHWTRRTTKRPHRFVDPAYSYYSARQRSILSYRPSKFITNGNLPCYIGMRRVWQYCISLMPPFFSASFTGQKTLSNNLILTIFFAQINLQFQLTASGPDLATGPSAPCHVVVGFNGGAGQCWWRRREVVGDASGEQRRRGSATQRFVRLLQVRI